MRGHGEKLTRKQEHAIAALLTEATVESAAGRAGVSETTLWRWLQLESFQAEYRAARRQVVENALASLQRATGEAVSTLQRNLSCGVPSIEVQAAKIIIDQAVKAIELLDLSMRLDTLERRMAQEEDASVAM